jgi:hypothetical protein
MLRFVRFGVMEVMERLEMRCWNDAVLLLLSIWWL